MGATHLIREQSSLCEDIKVACELDTSSGLYEVSEYYINGEKRYDIQMKPRSINTIDIVQQYHQQFIWCLYNYLICGN